MLDKPIRTIHNLYVIAFERSVAEAEKAEQDNKEGKEHIPTGAVEELVDLMEEGG